MNQKDMKCGDNIMKKIKVCYDTKTSEMPNWISQIESCMDLVNLEKFKETYLIFPSNSIENDSETRQITEIYYMVDFLFEICKQFIFSVWKREEMVGKIILKTNIINPVSYELWR